MKNKEKYLELKKRLLKYRSAMERVQRLRLRMDENRRGDDMEELKRRAERQEQRAIEYMNDLEGMLNLLEEGKRREVLELYFRNGLSHEEIAEQNSYTERHVKRLFSEGMYALLTLEKLSNTAIDV